MASLGDGLMKERNPTGRESGGSCCWQALSVRVRVRLCSLVEECSLLWMDSILHQRMRQCPLLIFLVVQEIQKVILQHHISNKSFFSIRLSLLSSFYTIT